jgi:hypothetical protein
MGIHLVTAQPRVHSGSEVTVMPPFSDWFPYALTGTFLTLFGLLKLYGLVRGVTSGRGRPMLERACGTCRRPLNRAAVTALPFLFLAIGAVELVLCARVFLAAK